MPYDGRFTDRIEASNRKLDLAVDVAIEKARRDLREMKRADALDQQEEREKARKDRDRCLRHQRVFDDSFSAHGVRAPAPTVDAHPPTYRRDLFRRGQELLPSDHPLTEFDANEIGGDAIAELERQLLAAIEAARRRQSIQGGR
jgi:hypothetical protein